MKQQASATSETSVKDRMIIDFTVKTIYAGIDVHQKDYQVAKVHNGIKRLLDIHNPATGLCLQKTIDISAATNKVVNMRPDNTPAADVYSAALSWFKYQPASNSSQIWADGGTSGFNSYLVLYPMLNSGVVVLANKSDEKTFRSLPGIAYEISKVPGSK